jgi:hypothetical protein
MHMNLVQTLRHLARSFCFLGVIAMVGCAGIGNEEVARPAPKPAHPAAVATAPTPPGVPPTPPGTPGRPAPAKRSSTETAGVPAPADINSAGPKLVGLTQAETVTMLGPPTAQWDRPPAKVWHYQGPDCAVDVFFYLDVSRNEFSALRYSVNGADPATAGGQLCISRIHEVAQRK